MSSDQKPAFLMRLAALEFPNIEIGFQKIRPKPNIDELKCGGSD